MSLAQEIRSFIQQNADPAHKSTQSKTSYTGSTHLHYGLSAPQMRGFLKAHLQEHQPDADAWLATLDALYAGESLEERAFAGMLLARFSRFRAGLSLERFNTWLETLEGWAEVDSTCQSTFTAKEFLAKWGEWEPFLRRLAADPNINKRRASLVLFIQPIRQTNDERLLSAALENIDRLKHEKDKLISKAISWLLREALKHHKAAVEAYIEANQAALPAFVQREVRTKLQTGKKQQP